MTAAPEVLSVLRASDLPLEAQAFDAAVIEGETPQTVGPGHSPWNILYSGAGDLVGTPGLVDPGDAAHILTVGRYRYWSGSMVAFPAWSGGKLARGDWSTGAGGAQVTKTTWRDNAGFGIHAFDPTSQAVFCWKLAVQRFAARYPAKSLLSALQGTESDRALIPAYLALTWPGGCGAGFPKRYGANLAALTSPPVPSVPGVITVSAPDQGVDQSGKLWSLVWKTASGAGAD